PMSHGSALTARTQNSPPPSSSILRLGATPAGVYERGVEVSLRPARGRRRVLRPVRAGRPKPRGELAASHPGGPRPRGRLALGRPSGAADTVLRATVLGCTVRDVA